MGFLDDLSSGINNGLNKAYNDQSKKIKQMLKRKTDDEIRQILSNRSLNSTQMQFVEEEANRRGIF